LPWPVFLPIRFSSGSEDSDSGASGQGSETLQKYQHPANPGRAQDSVLAAVRPHPGNGDHGGYLSGMYRFGIRENGLASVPFTDDLRVFT